ncbi:hypothetical protein EOPP23_05575 [Endozoicomonas sp. OPT23]|uniref:HupE/UreJ family protein n=1 Tax=Endozoicomonas sp. OPT23 TaxID=2072845 RepID=UPI00129A23F2|nr:HupE/UreJ family protein [Endozoicomonas sp. OPT23]MRI32454.1 hypothetical protein [Endozoicomonas sp. OPT23]
MKQLTTLFVFLFSLLAAQAQAHPMAPGLWALNEQAPGVFLVTWKATLKENTAEKAQPLFPNGCYAEDRPNQTIEGTGQISQWTMNCSAIELENAEFKVSGLEGSPSGVLFRMKRLDGHNQHTMLSSEQPSINITAAPESMDTMKTYLLSGFDHLVGGIDHVLFVLLLTLLVGWGRQLFWTITLFTLGHSVTLSLTVLGYVDFPVMLVESIIAFSIVVAAAEVIKRDDNSPFKKRPWLMSGSFGLLHGMGFAGALAEFGLPANDIPLALAAFNIGIEIGQLAVIALFVAAWKLLLKVKSDWPVFVRWIPSYACGALAGLWFWQRLGLEPLLAG